MALKKEGEKRESDVDDEGIVVKENRWPETMGQWVAKRREEVKEVVVVVSFCFQVVHTLAHPKRKKKPTLPTCPPRHITRLPHLLVGPSSGGFSTLPVTTHLSYFV